ncbi:MAG: PorT family protein [Acidobacteriia bacterium]|nr:PorT family protein [Terriglobia bacterium]
MLTKTVLFILLVAAVASAQPLGAGVKIGVPATDAFKVFPDPTLGVFSGESPRYTVGPYVELRLPARMAVEVDALYRSYDFRSAGVGASGSSWEFPVLIKHRFAAGLVRPYFDAGVSFSQLSDIKLSSLNHRSNYGIVVGGGLEFNLFLVKVSPEVRYTGWAFRNFDGSQVQSNRNQLAVLVGFGF